MDIIEIKKELSGILTNKGLDEKIEIINEIREYIHEFSPFKNEPVDFVKWVKSENVVANDYNPNKVAPPEMELLEISITNDGYTQPIVTFPNGNNIEVVDGFHRHRVGRESQVVSQRIKGFLPTVIIKPEQSDKNNRIASTIRHNRARGKHTIDAMSEIVIELKNRNWANKRIARELGMDEDEILRLCQISGLQDIFKDSDFSKSWNAEDSVCDDFEMFDGKVSEIDKQQFLFRTVNTSDENRIFHTYDKWECYKAGFYNKTKDGMSKEECEIEYANFLSNNSQFEKGLKGVTTEWVHSCEHYLTNSSMNRIAWLGQAACCYVKGIPSEFRAGFHLLSEKQQNEANVIAHKYLNKWLQDHGFEQVSFDDALQINRKMEIY